MEEEIVEADDTAAQASDTATVEADDTAEEVTYSLEKSEDDKPKEPQGMVPSWRLREEAGKRQELEQRLAALEKPDDTDKLKRRFGTEEEGGPDAYETVSELSRITADRLFEEKWAEREAALRREMDAKVGGVTASLQTTQTLATMKGQGIIDDAVEKEIGARMSAVIASEPAWGASENQEHLLNKVYMDMLRSGEIKPRRRQQARDTSPIQPGGGGKSEAQEREEYDNMLRETANRSTRLKDLPIERLREMLPKPTQPLSTGQNGEMTFVHRRN